MTRIPRWLTVVATGLSLETRARCQDDNHQPATFNPLLGVTFCHCGRIWHVGKVPIERWPDRCARLSEHTRTDEAS